MVICLVDQDGHVFGQSVEQLLHVLLRHDHARRVVRVAEIHEPDVAVVGLRGVDDRRNILAMILRQLEQDGVALDARDVLIHLTVGRLDADDFLATLGEGRSHHIEDLS